MSSILPINQMTVCMFLRQVGVRRREEMILARKTRPPFAELLLPHGGKLDPGETHLECVVREVKDETGGAIIHPSSLEKVCIVKSRSVNGEGLYTLNEVHFYTTYEWENEIRTSEEMRDPNWYEIERLPFDEMPLADAHYFPQLLQHKQKLVVEVQYGPGRLSLIQKPQIREVGTFESL